MAYEKLNLAKGDIFKAEHVAHMEEGIAQNDEKLVELSEDKLDKGSPAAHQQMVTDAYSVATWEDKTHYDGDTAIYGETIYDPNVSDSGAIDLVFKADGSKLHENARLCVTFNDQQHVYDPATTNNGTFLFGQKVHFEFTFNRKTNSFTASAKILTPSVGDTLSVAYTYPTLKQLDEKFIPNTIARTADVPIIQTATVGQTIAVKAVDENGKPTEWEAVDAASGGGVVVFYLDSNDWEGYLYKDEALSTKVTYNELFAAVVSSMIVLHWANEYQTAYVYPTTLSSVSPEEAATYAEVEYSLFGEDCVVHTSEWTKSSGPQ